MTHVPSCPVMFFSGKGGVGKTTLAAATGVHLASAGKRVLVVSTDPAHSLSDVFDVDLSSEPQEISRNLFGMEVDTRTLLRTVETENFGDPSVSGERFNKFLQLASQAPGIDEFGAIELLLDVIDSNTFDVVILDTAPTGHTLRMLMLPELLDGWFGTLLTLRAHVARAQRILMRLFPRKKNAEREMDFASGIEQSRDRISDLRKVLTDPQRAQIFLVTIPEAMSVLETTRTLNTLRSHHLAVGAIVANQLQPVSLSCSHCNQRHAMHLAEIQNLRSKIGRVPLHLVHSEPDQIRGFDALAQLAKKIWADSLIQRNCPNSQWQTSEQPVTINE